VKLYHTISKFHHNQQSYGTERNLLQGRPVTLTIICENNILIQPQTTKLWPRSDDGQTDGWTKWQLYF